MHAVGTCCVRGAKAQSCSSYTVHCVFFCKFVEDEVELSEDDGVKLSEDKVKLSDEESRKQDAKTRRLEIIYDVFN